MLINIHRFQFIPVCHTIGQAGIRIDIRGTGYVIRRLGENEIADAFVSAVALVTPRNKKTRIVSLGRRFPLQFHRLVPAHRLEID